MVNAAEFDVTDLGNDRVAVAPREGAGAVRDFFNVRRVATAQTDISGDEPWAFLAVRPPFAQPGVQIPPAMIGKFQQLSASPELAALRERLGVEASLTDVERLPDLFRRELPALFEHYPDGSLWYVEADQVLTRRLTSLKLMLQLAVAPDSPYGTARTGVAYFGAHQLTAGIMFSEAVQPILLTYSPVVFGFVMNTPPGAFVFTFGQLDNDHDLRELHHRSLATGYHPSVNSHPFAPGIKMPMDKLGLGEMEALLGWWATRLNIIYSYAADPTRFVTPTGDYDPLRQAAWFFTFERMLGDFAALGSAVTSPGILRMQGAFDALDKAASLLCGDDAKVFKRFLDRDRTLPRIHTAFDQLPMQARSRFKQWATESYDQLYSDIRQQTMPGRITGDGRGVKVGYSSPTDLRLMPWPEYVSELIREARNSSHGLMDMLTYTPANKRPRRLLLATNQGDVPTSLYEVARVVVFALMADAAALCEQTW
jgi:hypothetical protein